MFSFGIHRLILGVCAAFMLTSCTVRQGVQLSSVSEEICLPKIVTLAEIGVARSRAAITAMKNEDESFSSGVTSFYLLDAGTEQRGSYKYCGFKAGLPWWTPTVLTLQ